MGTIFKREFKSYFTNMTGYVFIFIFLVVADLFTILNLGYPYFDQVIATARFWLVFPCFILTMRAFSADRRSKADQLLLTAPVSISSIVFGKYLALVAVYAIPLAVTGLFPILFSFYGTINFIACYGAIFGLFLLGACVLAVGMFISSLTDSQIIAAIATLAVMLFCVFLPSIVSTLASGTGAVSSVLSTVLGWMSLFEPMSSFANNLFDMTAVVYYISVAALFVFFTVQAVEKRRWS